MYHQIIPGVSNHLYPTLLADGLLGNQVADNHGTLQDQITSAVDKYLQEATERCEGDVNYIDGWHVATNTSSQHQKADFAEHDEQEVLESNGNDTGGNGAQNAECNIQYYDDLETIPEEEEEEEEEDPQMYGSPTYRYLRMGMGMSVSPQIWQQFVDLVFQDDLIKCKQNFGVIMDDMFIHSTAEEHMHDLMDLFKVLRKYGLKISPHKC